MGELGKQNCALRPTVTVKSQSQSHETQEREHPRQPQNMKEHEYMSDKHMVTAYHPAVLLSPKFNSECSSKGFAGRLRGIKACVERPEDLSGATQFSYLEQQRTRTRTHLTSPQ